MGGRTLFRAAAIIAAAGVLASSAANLRWASRSKVSVHHTPNNFLVLRWVTVR